MARVPYLDQSDFAPENRDLLPRNIKLYRKLTAQPDLSDETHDDPKKGPDNERIVDLLQVISFYCGVVRLLGALQIDVEEDYRKYLQEFPLGG